MTPLKIILLTRAMNLAVPLIVLQGSEKSRRMIINGEGSHSPLPAHVLEDKTNVYYFRASRVCKDQEILQRLADLTDGQNFIAFWI